jgi:O-methyltransferase involved in polyketide biosynthesis
MIRHRAPLAVRTAATSEPVFMQSAHAVAERALRYLREQALELVLAHHAERAQEIEQATVEIGQRAVGITATTRPHDTNAVARSRARQNRPPKQEMDKNDQTVGRAKATHKPQQQAKNSPCQLADRLRANGKASPDPATGRSGGKLAALGVEGIADGTV